MLRVLSNISCDLDPKVKGQKMYFLANVSSPKPSDKTTSNFLAE